MNTILTTIIAVVMGLLGILFGVDQRNKKKQAEIKAKTLETEVKHKEEEIKLTGALHATHAAEIAEIASAPDDSVIQDANSLFTADNITAGSALKKERIKKHISLQKAHQLSGLGYDVIVKAESNKEVTADIINKLGKIYELSGDRIKEIQSLLKSQPSSNAEKEGKKR